MKKIYILSVLSVVAFLYSHVFATNGLYFIGLGPVQRSMGGVGAGLSLDSSAMIANPACMSALNGRVDFGVSYLTSNAEYKATGLPGFGVIKYDNETIKSDAGAGLIPAIGVIIPRGDDLRFAIGAYAIAGVALDYKANLYGNVTHIALSIMKFTPSVSYKINKDISVGFTTNILYGSGGFSAGFHPEDTLYGVQEGAGMGNVSQEPHLVGNFFGFGGTIGISYNLIEDLKIGIAYETESKSEDIQFNTYHGKDRLEFSTPQNITGGIGIKPAKKILIGFDIRYFMWDDVIGEKKLEWYISWKDDILRSASTRPRAMDINWDNQIVYMAGVQYEIDEDIIIRMGYNYGKAPIDKEKAFENILFPCVIEHHITAGIGYNINKELAINIGGVYSPETSVEGDVSSITLLSAQYYLLSYETRMSYYSIDCGLTYKF